MRVSYLITMLAALPACGSRRIADYLAENCSLSSSTTDEAETTHSSGPGSSSSGSGETTVENPETAAAGSETTGTSSDTGGTTDASESAGDADSTTGGPVAACGNGIVEAFGPEPEECDDGNSDPDDGCSDTCALDRGVFVTSVRYQGADLESLKIADARCFNRADDQGLSEALKYRAWLSDSTTDARDRFKRGRGRLVMVNGLVFAASWDALLAGALENPLEVTEKSETYQDGVWTGTRPDGTAVPGAEHCVDWSSSAALKKGHYGYSDRKTAEWTLAEDADQPSSCPSEYAIYCFQSL